MRYSRLSQIILVSTVILLQIGCRHDPVTPGAMPEGGTQAQAATSAQVRHCLGYYGLIVDTESLDVDVVPIRSANWHFNVTGILNTTMGVSAVGVPSEHDPAHGLFVFDITLTHPFAGKPQFTGFDVKGILMTPGTLAVGNLIFADAYETCLENADGYTRWWNPTEFTKPGMFGYTDGILASAAPGALTSTVNPYKLFADILTPDGSLGPLSDQPLDSDQGRGVFTSGTSNTRRYRIRFPMDPGPKIVYGYAIDAAWGLPSPNPPGEVPDDFPIEANQPEAYRIGLMAGLNTLYYDSESGAGGGTLKLQLNVHDWQGQLAGDFGAQMAGARIYAPDLMGSGVDAVYLDDTPVKRRFTVDLTGLASPSKSGETRIICRVGSTDGSTYVQGSAPAPDSPLSAFHAISVDVIDPDCTADTNNEFNEAQTLSLAEPTVAQLCAPTDYRDFYSIEVPMGWEVSGQLTFYCDVEPTTFGLYDGSQALVAEVSVSGGTASIDLTALSLTPDTYYLRVLTQSSGQAFLYAIEPNADVVDVTPSNAQRVTPAGLYFEPKWVTLSGDIAYATGSWGFWTIDYSVVTMPEMLGYLEIQCNYLCEPAYSDPYIYYFELVGGSTYVDVIDVSDPNAPVLHTNILTIDLIEATSIEVEAGWLYIGLSQLPTSVVQVYDVSGDPLVPQLYTSFDAFEAPLQLELMRDSGGPTLWLAARYASPRLDFFDVTDKSGIFLDEHVNWAPAIYVPTFTTQGNYLYVIVRDGLGDYYLEIFLLDASGIALQSMPMLIHTETPVCLTCEGDFAYIADNDTTMQIVDVSDPLNPGFPLWLGMGINCVTDMDAEGETMVCALGVAGMRAFGLSNPGSPANAGKVIGLAVPADFAIAGDYLYAAEYMGFAAIRTVDISDPPNARVVAELELNAGPGVIETSGSRMVAGSVFGSNIDLIDCSDPENLLYLNSVTAAGPIRDMVFNGNRLYAAEDTPNVLEVWNLDPWPLITSMYTIPMTNPGYDLCIKENVLYLVSQPDLLFYSLANPDYPEYIDTYTTFGDAWNIALQGDYLYAATTGTIEIIDVSTPQTPTFVASEPDPNTPYGRYITVDGQFAYLQPMHIVPPTVVRIWPPNDPAVIGDLYTDQPFGMPYQILAHNGYYIERAYLRAIEIWDLY